MATSDRTTDRSIFEALYAGQAPWDIGKPQQAFVDAADQVRGDVLDAGCGTGDMSLFFAGRGCKVTGIDFLDEAIRREKKAAEQKSSATFLVGDALALKTSSEHFDAVLDSGLFHVFRDEDRKLYVEGLATVLKPGGRILLMCFSDEEPGNEGPRRVSKQDLHAAFAHGWVIESIRPYQIETRPDLKDFVFSEGGPRGWFAVIRRADSAPPIETIVETSIYADDLESMEKFYATVLGLPVMGKEIDRHVFFRVGTASVLLIFKPDTTLRGETLPSHGTRGPGHFALGVPADALEQWRQHLLAHNIAIEREVAWPRGGRSLYFRDPAANSVEIMTRGVWGLTPSGW